MIKTRQCGAGDGSAGKLLFVQAWGPELETGTHREEEGRGKEKGEGERHREKDSKSYASYPTTAPHKHKDTLKGL